MKKQEYRAEKTNQSASKTTMTALVHQNIPDIRIVQLSRHENVKLIHYYSVAALEQQREMSNMLSTEGTVLTV